MANLPFVLTLIGPDRPGSLPPEMAALAAAELSDGGAEVGALDWLCEAVACDIPFGGLEPVQAETIVRARFPDTALDIAAQPAEGRRKRLLLADMESTIITRELIDELARLAGIGEQIAAITRRSMRGEIDFAQSLRERVAMLAGRPDSLLAEVEPLIELMPGARQMVATMRAAGARTVLVSGGFDRFASIAARLAGFDAFHANHLETAGGALTGRVAEPILDRQGKRAILAEEAARLGLAPAETAAIGDGANDIAMLQSAGLGVAYHAKPAVAAAARYRLEQADLTGLLYFQGYRARDFKV